MPITELQLRQAGYSQSRIDEFFEDETENLQNAGFSTSRINNHFGIVPTNIKPFSYDDIVDYEEEEIYNKNTESLLKETDNTKIDNTPIDLEQNLTELQNNPLDDLLTNNKIKKEIPTDTNNIIDPQYEQNLIYGLEKEKEINEKGYDPEKLKILSNSLTPEEEVYYFNTKGTIKRDGLDLEVVENYGKKEILNTVITSGVNSNVVKKVFANNGIDGTYFSTITDSMSFYSAEVSKNRNISLGDGNSEGFFGIEPTELNGLLNIFINKALDVDANWQKPNWIEIVRNNKDITKIPADGQRALALIKLFDNNSIEDLKIASTGNEEYLKKIYKNAFYNQQGPAEFNLETNSFVINDKEFNEDMFLGYDTLEYKYTAPYAGFISKDFVPDVIKNSYTGRKIIEKLGGMSDMNAIGKNFGMSASSLIYNFGIEINENGLTPKEAYEEWFMYKANFSSEMAGSMALVIGDIPAMIAGAGIMAGMTLATIPITGGLSTPLVPYMAVGGAFSFPETIRHTYIKAIMNNEIDNVSDLMDEFTRVETLKAFAKGQIVGMGTAGAGKLVSSLGGKKLLKTSAEIGTMVSLSSFLEGQVPSRKDFIHAAALIFTIQGAGKGVNKLYYIFAKYGIHPKDIVTLAEKNAVINNDLLNPNVIGINAFEKLNSSIHEAVENATNTKFVDPPKFTIGSKIVHTNGLEGTITSIGKKRNSYVIKTTSGQTRNVKEKDLKNVSKNDIEVTIKENGKLEITDKIEIPFKDAKTKNQFDKNIIQIDKKRIDYINNPSKNLKSKNTQYNDLVNRKLIFTEKSLDKTIGNKTIDRTQVVFELNNNFVFRDSKNNYISFPIDLINVIKQNSTEFMIAGNILITQKNGINISGIRGTKLNAKLTEQAKTYYNNYIPKKDRIYPNEKIRLDEKIYDKNNEPLWPNAKETRNNEKIIETLESSKDDFLDSFYNNTEGLTNIDIFNIARVLIEKTPELENMKSELRGYFRWYTKDGKINYKIAINEALQKNPKQFLRTLAHELGHAIDQIPNSSIDGGILSRISGIKIYMNEWISGKNNGAKELNILEIAELKKLAGEEAIAKRKEINKEIVEELKIKPSQIIEIFTDVNIVNKINPQFYDAFKRLNNDLKKLIVRSAMKGMLDQNVISIVNRINKVKPNTNKIQKQIDKETEIIFKNLFEKEMIDRGFVNRELVTMELTELSKVWRPYDLIENPLTGKLSAADKKYKKYRDKPEELMADFMMSYLFNPKWTKLNAPKSYELFENHLNNRPKIAEILSLLRNQKLEGNDTYFSIIIKNMSDRFAKSKTKLAEAKKENKYVDNILDETGVINKDVFTYLYRRRKVLGKKFEGNLKDTIERNRYIEGIVESYTNAISRIVEPIREANIDLSIFSTFLYMNNLMKSKQRVNLANPEGFFADNVSKRKNKKLTEDEKLLNDFLKSNRNISPTQMYNYLLEKYPVFKIALDEYYNYRAKVILPIIKESGYFEKEALNNIIENTEYISFNVLEYALEKAKAGRNNVATATFSKQSLGTMKDIVDPLLASVSKDMLIIVELTRNKLQNDMVNVLLENKPILENFQNTNRFRGGKETILKSKKELETLKDPVIELAGNKPVPKGMKEIVITKEGKRIKYFINQYAAAAFERNPFVTSQIFQTLGAVNSIFKAIYTEYNVQFWAKNFMRDVQRSLRNIPNATLFDVLHGGKNSYLKYMFTTFGDTRSSIYNVKGKTYKEYTKLAEESKESGAFMADRSSYRTPLQDFQGAGKTEQLIEKQLVGKFTPREYQKLYDTTIVKFAQHMQLMARFIERWPKMAGFKQLKEQSARGQLNDPYTGKPLTNQQIATIVQSQVGSPSFLRVGTNSALISSIGLFINPMLEGWRGDAVRFKESPLEVAAKFAAYSLAPKIIQKGLKIGLAGETIKAFYKGVKDYDEENYLIVPLVTTADGRSVYLRIPQDETARILSGTAGIALEGIANWITNQENEIGLSDIVDKVASEASLSANPLFPLVIDIIGFARGDNPTNNYGGPAIDPDINIVGGKEKAKEAAKYLWNTYGGKNIYRLKSNDRNEVMSELEELLQFPILGKFANTFIVIGDSPMIKTARDFQKDKLKNDAIERVIKKNVTNKWVFNANNPDKQEDYTDKELNYINNMTEKEFYKIIDTYKLSISREIADRIDFIFRSTSAEDKSDAIENFYKYNNIKMYGQDKVYSQTLN